jgi:hypothetical protein
MSSFWNSLLIAIGAIIAIMDVFFPSVSKKIDTGLTCVMKKIKPSRINDSIHELHAEVWGLPLGLIFASFLLHGWSSDHSALLDRNIFKTIVAVIVLIFALFVAMVAACFVVVIVVSIAFGFIGLYLHTSNILARGKHLAFTGIPMALIGIIQLFTEQKNSDGIFVILVVSLTIFILQFAAPNSQRKSYWPFLLTEIRPLLINTTKGSGIIILAVIAIVYYWSAAHTSLYLHNESVEWKTPLQKPIDLGNIKVTDIEFGIMVYKGSLRKPVLKSVPMYELNAKDRKAIAFAVKFDKPVSIYTCHFLAYHIDSTGKKKLILNEVYGYEGELGWSVNMAPFHLIKELDSIKHGHLDVYYGIGPAYKDSATGKFLYLANGRLAIHKEALLPKKDIQKHVLVLNDSLGKKYGKFVEEIN